MSGGQFRYLFSPLRLGPVTVRNRIVFSAHLTNYAEHGMPSEQHAAYYEARAAGGAGLIITEEHSTHPTDWPYEKMIHAFHPEVVPGYRRITEAVHRHNVPVFAQINHNGGQASSMYTRLPVWAPSAVPDPLFREVPKAVTQAEIAEIVRGYATVAARCKEGGFDGIELQCSHSSIVRGFLSQATNQRTDQYGGTLENRARILHEIVAAVREAIGHELALGVRLCGDELIEGGITLDECVEVARQVEAHGRADYINTSIGVATATLFMIEASMHIPPEYALFIPSAHPQGGAAPHRRRGPVQGPPPGRTGARRRPLRSGRRGPRPDRGPRLRRQGQSRPTPRHPPVSVLQPGVRGPDGAQPLAGLHREPPYRQRGRAGGGAANRIRRTPATAAPCARHRRRVPAVCRPRPPPRRTATG